MASAFDKYEQPVTSPEPTPPGPSQPPVSAFARYESASESQEVTSPTVGGGEAAQSVSQPPIGGPSETGRSAFSAYETPEETAAWQKEISDRSIFDKPVLGAEPTTSAELAQIAAKHGVPAGELEQLAPYFGARMAGADFASVPEFKRAAGGIGSVALGIPQKLYKMSQSPEMERALDDVQKLAGGRSSYLQNIAEVAAPIGGVARTASTAAKVASGAAFGAAGGFGASQQGAEISSTSIGAGLGGALGGAVAGVEKLIAGRAANRAAASAAEESVDRVVQRGGADFEEGVREAVARNADADAAISSHIFRGEELTPESAELIARTYALEALAEGKRPAEEIAQGVINRHANDLAEDVLKRSVSMRDDSIALLRSAAGQSERSGKGTEYLEGRLQGQLNLETAIRHLEERGIAEGKPTGWVSKQLDRLSDAQFVFRGMDEKWVGLGAEDAHKQIVRGVNQLSFPREDMRQQVSRIFRGLRREKLDQQARNAGDLIQAVESGSTLTSDQQRVYAPFREFFANALDSLGRLADEAGVPRLSIKQKDNYIPAQLADDIQGRMADRIQAIVDDASAATGTRYTDIAQVPANVYNQIVSTSADHASTLKFLHTLSGESGNTPAAVSLAWKNAFLNPQQRSRMETVARAALEREDLIPIWARETDLYKLSNKWITNTLRDVYLRQGVDKLRNVTKLLRSRGATAEAEYGEKLLADLMGTRAGTAAEATTRAQQVFLRKMDQLISKARSPGHRVALETVRTLPAFLQSLAKEVYPNLLGALNPRTLIMNLTQTFTKTLPEFGGPYGSALFFRGAARVGGLRNLSATARRMEAMGLAPKRFVGGSLDFLDEGIARSGVAQKLKAGTRWLADVGMKPYELAETVNRSIAFGASEMMANDLMRGSKLAESALMRFPTSVRRNVERARQSGDMGEVVREIATHVVNSTQYQYNRASMSEYGRTLGSLFSTFSKWPTATLGQTVEAYRTKGLLGGTTQLGEQLIAPMVLLEGADYLLGQHTEEGLSDRQKKLFGASGLSGAAPLGTLKGIATGDFFTPPVIDTALRMFMDPVMSKDSEQAAGRMKKAAENGLYMFAPGGVGGWLRFLTDDMVTLYSGERPEGTTQLERAGLDPFGRDDD